MCVCLCVCIAIIIIINARNNEQIVANGSRCRSSSVVIVISMIVDFGALSIKDIEETMDNEERKWEMIKDGQLNRDSAKPHGRRCSIFHICNDHRRWPTNQRWPTKWMHILVCVLLVKWLWATVAATNTQNSWLCSWKFMFHSFDLLLLLLLLLLGCQL